MQLSDTEQDDGLAAPVLSPQLTAPPDVPFPTSLIILEPADDSGLCGPDGWCN